MLDDGDYTVTDLAKPNIYGLIFSQLIGGGFCRTEMKLLIEYQQDNTKINRVSFM